MLQKKKISFLLTRFGVDTGRYGPFGSVCFLPVLVSIFFCSELLAQLKRAALSPTGKTRFFVTYSTDRVIGRFYYIVGIQLSKGEKIFIENKQASNSF